MHSKPYRFYIYRNFENHVKKKKKQFQKRENTRGMNIFAGHFKSSFINSFPGALFRFHASSERISSHVVCCCGGCHVGAAPADAPCERCGDTPQSTATFHLLHFSALGASQGRADSSGSRFTHSHTWVRYVKMQHLQRQKVCSVEPT